MAAAVHEDRRIDTRMPLTGGGDLSADRTLSFSELFDVHAYGAVGDGTTDDQPAIQAAIDALKAAGRGILWFHAGRTYRHDLELVFDDMHGFVIVGNRARTLNGDAPPLPPPGQPLFLTQACLRFRACSNFTITDLVVDGNRAERMGPSPPTNATGPNSIVLQQCSEFSLCGVSSNNAVGDGYYLRAQTPADPGTYTRNGQFVGCSAEGCFRDGLTMINAVDIQVLGGTFSRQSGTNPQTGIQLEPNANSADPGVERITIQGASFFDNAGRGVGVAARVRHVTITGCTFSRCDRAAVVLRGAQVAVEGCTFEDFGDADSAILDVAGPDQATIAGNLLRRITAALPAIRVSAQSTRVVVANNNLYDVARAGIDSFAPGTLITGNRLEKVGGVGIELRGANSVVSSNVIVGAASFAVHLSAPNARVLGNVVLDTARSGAGGDIQAEAPATGASIDHNTIVIATPDAARSAIYCFADPASVVGNRVLGFSPALAIRFASGHTDAANDLPSPRFANSGAVDGLEIHRFRLGGAVHFAAAAAPTSGTWARGDLVFNTQPTPGGFVGWVCTSAGTPGAWSIFGSISP